MTLFLVFCGLILCFFCPFLIILFLIGFVLYCMADVFGISIILLPLGVITFGAFLGSIFDPVIMRAKKDAKEKWDEFNAVKLYCDDPEEYHRQLQATQPKMSAETKARIRRIQKQMKEKQKKRVDNTMKIARDYPSRHKKR